MTIRSLRTLLMLALMLVAVACSSNGDGDGDGATAAPTVRPGQHGPTANGEFTFEGALELEGEYSVLYSFVDENADTCAKISGRNTNGGYVVPLPTFVDDRRFTWSAGIRNYGGPGRYELSDLGQLSLAVSKTPDADPVEYTSNEDTTVEIEVDRRNAGSFAFRGLESDKGERISGEASWTCEEGSEGEEE